jgi:RNA polymerase sigma factor (sigma-70 family)
VAPDDKQAFVAALVREHGQGLRRYLASRLREAAGDLQDLIQEVYLRLLRVPHHETIRSPQAYLFTVAHHVLHQHRMSRAATPESVDFMEVAQMQTSAEDDPSVQAEIDQRLQQLDRALEEVSPRARAAFVLYRRFGYSLDQIAEQMGVSRPMVRKYLIKAIAHCKTRVEDME